MADIRALMVDVDGVLIRPHAGHGWQRDLASDLGVDPEALNRRFFADVFPLVSQGRADLEPTLAAVLAEVAPDVSAGTLIEYWFVHDTAVDRRLVADLDDVRGRGIEVHLATTQEHRRARHLWHSLGFSSHFDGFHYSAEIGFAKPDPEFYRAVEQRTGFTPGELLLIDDRAENVQAAREGGWGAHLWTADSRLSDLDG